MRPTLRPTLFRPGTRGLAAAWRGSTLTTLILIVLIVGMGILLVGRHQLRKQEEAKRRLIFASLTDPVTALDNYFLNTNRPFNLARADWKVLLDYTSSEDTVWLRDHLAYLAGRGNSLNTSEFGGTPEELREFLALSGLYTATGQHNPIIAGSHSDGMHAVVFYHRPGEENSMREAFLVNEGGRWKIRRFLGSRDAFPLMQEIVVSKQAAGAALSADEQQFTRDPAGYSDWKRNQLLAETGAIQPAPQPMQPMQQPQQNPLQNPLQNQAPQPMPQQAAPQPGFQHPQLVPPVRTPAPLPAQ